MLCHLQQLPEVEAKKKKKAGKKKLTKSLQEEEAGDEGDEGLTESQQMAQYGVASIHENGQIRGACNVEEQISKRAKRVAPQTETLDDHFVPADGGNVFATRAPPPKKKPRKNVKQSEAAVHTACEALVTAVLGPAAHDPNPTDMGPNGLATNAGLRRFAELVVNDFDENDLEEMCIDPNVLASAREIWRKLPTESLPPAQQESQPQAVAPPPQQPSSLQEARDSDEDWH
jgi:hypothetical protein